jgi:hypothetical protein
VVFVNLKDSTRASDVPGLWYQVRKKVGDIKRTLSEGVQGPFFNDEFGDTSFAEYVIGTGRYVGRLPHNSDMAQMAPILCAGVTSYKGIEETEARPGEWLAISGIGALVSSPCNTPRLDMRTRQYHINEVLADLEAGKIDGRAIT